MNEIPSLLQNIRKFNFINETKIYNEIQNNKKILVVDLRSKSDYVKMSLPNSVNLPFDEKPNEFFENFISNISPDLSEDHDVKEMLCKFRRFYIAIIFSEEKFHRKEIINYDAEKLRSHEALYKALCLYRSLSANKVREMGVHLKGFSSIVAKYFFIVRNDLNEPLFSDICQFPSEIIENKIFVGDQIHAQNEKILEFLNVTHIINITKHVENKFEGKETLNLGIKYLKIPIDDTEKYLISAHFEDVFFFIEEALRKTENLRNQETEYENEETQRLLKSFAELYDLDFNKPEGELITSADIEKISDLQVKNKICQLLIKAHFSGYNHNNRILIHCSMGVSRSPALVIMYLMKKIKLSFESVKNIIFFKSDFHFKNILKGLLN